MGFWVEEMSSIFTEYDLILYCVIYALQVSNFIKMRRGTHNCFSFYDPDILFLAVYFGSHTLSHFTDQYCEHPFFVNSFIYLFKYSYFYLSKKSRIISLSKTSSSSNYRNVRNWRKYVTILLKSIKTELILLVFILTCKGLFQLKRRKDIFNFCVGGSLKFANFYMGSRNQHFFGQMDKLMGNSKEGFETCFRGVKILMLYCTKKSEFEEKVIDNTEKNIRKICHLLQNSDFFHFFSLPI